MKKIFYLVAVALCLGFTACSSDDDNDGTVIDKELDKAQVESSLIFKQLYFTGVMSYYAQDAFFEIVNNSDKTEYLDGVILGIVDRGWGDGWSAAPSAWLAAGETRYPMTSYTVYFPGNGDEYPLAAGESVIVATNAVDHTTIHPAGDEDDASPVNLTNADFEMFSGVASAYFTDTDNPDVPNMVVAYKKAGNDFMPGVSGQSLILAKLPTGTSVADYVANEDNYADTPGAAYNGKHLLMINSEYILDAVNIVNPNVDGSIDQRTVLTKDDAGQTFFNAGIDAETGVYNDPMYSGKAIQRKVYKTVKGIKKYSDTNNSTKDFETCAPTVPTVTE